MMRKLHILLALCLAIFTQTLLAQTAEQEEKIKVVVTDDGVLFNGTESTMDAVPEQFWQALQRNPRIKYSIAAANNKPATVARMQSLSKAVMEHISRQQMVGTSNQESRLRIDITPDHLTLQLGKDAPRQISVNEMDTVAHLVCDFISTREVGEKHLFVLEDGTEFEHTPNDAVIVTFASERGTDVERVAQAVSDAIADGFDLRRSALCEQVLSLPYHDLDNLSRSVFMAAVPKRTQSNVQQLQQKRVREIKREDNSKAVDLLAMCLVKADGTFAWEGKSYSLNDIQKVLGTDFDTSKLMFDAPLVEMIMEEAFGKKAPDLNHIDTATLMRLLGFGAPDLVAGVVNVVAHSAKVLRANPELVDAYVPIAINSLDLVALDADGAEVQQIKDAASLEVRFTIAGNDSCRSGAKRFSVSVLELASATESLVHHTAQYENVDLPVTIPIALHPSATKGTYLVSVQRGKQSLGVIEVEMR